MDMKALVLTLVAVGLAGCTVRTTTSEFHWTPPKIDPVLTPDSHVLGAGQPGVITVRGAAVTGSDLNPAISVEPLGGKDKSGQRVEVKPENKPVLQSATPPDLDLKSASLSKSLIAYGCDTKTVAEYAEEHRLTQVEDEKVTKASLVEANVIIFCGDVSQFNTILKSDTLIFSNVTSEAKLITSTFQTNYLILDGKNDISAKSAAPLVPANLELDVLKSVTVQNGGTLKISSQGSDAI
jgi:hypothetical protein